MGTPSGIEALSSLRPGDHVCWTYGSDESRKAGVSSYFRAGLDRGDRILVVAEPDDEDFLLSSLKTVSAQPEPLSDGAVRVVRPSRIAPFDANALVGRIREEHRAARDDGYRALRLVGEMTWAIPNLGDLRELVQFERALDGALQGTGVIVLCGYDARRLPDALVAECAHVHPLVVPGSRFGPPVGLGTLTVASETDEGCIRLEGEIDIANGDEFAAFLSRLVPGDHVVLDCSALTFIDVNGARLLRDAARRLDHGGGSLVLRGAGRHLGRLLALTGWDRAPGLTVQWSERTET